VAAVLAPRLAHLHTFFVAFRIAVLDNLSHPTTCRGSFPCNNEEKRTALPRPGMGRRQLEDSLESVLLSKELQP
jgi:hypothetical protein